MSIQHQIPDMEKIVASAVGLDRDRGDEIQVARFTFNKTYDLERQSALDAAAHQEQIMQYIQLGSGLVLLLLFLIFLILRLRRKKKSGAENSILSVQEGSQPVTLKEAERLLASQREAQRLLEQEVELKLAQKRIKTQAEIEREKLRKEVDKYIDNNPDEVARLIKSWMVEEQ